MAVQSLSHNPFALSTARNTWKDRNHSLPTKIGKGALGAVFDIFLKNPYELTIGNISRVMHNPDAYSTMAKTAVYATAVLTIPYTLTLYGSTIYLCGHCIEVLGSNAGLEAATKVGEVFQSVGNSVFLAGATPLYTIFYALPKYILESIPKIASFVSDRVALATNWMFQNMLIPLWKGIEPIATKISDVAITIYNFIAAGLNAALQAISNLVSSVATWTLNNVLILFWKNTLLPLLHVIGRTIYYVLDQMNLSLHALKTTIENTAQWLFTNAVEPSLKFLAQGITYVAKEIANVLSIVAGKTTDIAQWIMQNAIAPSWNLLKPVFEEIGKAASPCIDYLGRSIPKLVKTVAKIASHIFQNMLVPAFNGVVSSAVTVGNLLHTRVIVPVEASLASLMEKISQILSVFG